MIDRRQIRLTLLAAVGAVPLLALQLALLAPTDVVIKDLTYSPTEVKVVAGDAVRWTNKDDRDHTVVCEGLFVSENISPGGTFSYTFEKAGSYNYGCKYHPRMGAKVTVTAK